MEKIRDIESQQEPKSRSSYASTWTKLSTHSEDEDFFMHHYVDYFFGTSTGG